MGRLDFKGILERIIDYHRETTKIRFFSRLLAFGVMLVGATWVNLVLRISEKYLNIPADGMDNLGTYLGIAFTVIGLAGWIYELHQIPKRKQKKIALKLVTSLGAVHKHFSASQQNRDCGYGGVEIMACIEAAREYLKVAPRKFAGNRVIAVIANGSIDASKKYPFFNVNLEDIDQLISEIMDYYND